MPNYLNGEYQRLATQNAAMQKRIKELEHALDTTELSKIEKHAAPSVAALAG